MAVFEKYLKKKDFSSYEDFMDTFKIDVPVHFNFGYDVVDVYAEKQPEKVAITWTDGHSVKYDVTYKDLKEKSDKIASFLQGIGIEKGDRVLLILRRRIEWWYTMVALHKLGAVAIPANHQLSDKDIAYRCIAAGVKAIICCDTTYVMENVQKANYFANEVHHLIYVNDGNSPKVEDEEWIDFWKAVNEAPEFKPMKRVNMSSDNMLIYFTSGTTSHPKMVVHDYAYPLAHILTARFWQCLNEESRLLTVTDSSWVMAVWGMLYGQLLVGATVVVYDYEGKFDAANLLHVIEDCRVTSFFSPPTVYRFMLNEDLTKYDLSSLTYCVVAGELAHRHVYDDWKKYTGIEMKECYGQTEVGLVTGFFPWVESRTGSIGKASPLYSMDLLNENMEVCDVDEVGQVAIRIDRGRPLGVFKEYFKDKDAMERNNHDGYYFTGDLARKDKDGYYWFVSRADDVIKSSGYRISPSEVETALMLHPAVLECAVTGVPDEVRGQLIKATIVLKSLFQNEAGPKLAKEIQEFCKMQTSPYKYPRVVEFVQELPRTTTGKIRRAAIRRQDVILGTKRQGTR
ncbi:MAG: AMP-binding protein [Prevotella sp.]|nr:AMP-binding protein [Prevotella sp.]